MPATRSRRLFDALAQSGEMTIIGGLRGLHLPCFVRQAGFDHVRCTVTTIERWAPLRPVEAALVAERVGWLARQANGGTNDGSLTFCI